MAPMDDPTRFLLCVTSGDYPVSLEPRKVYRTLPDAIAESRGMVRVIDESGEDYLYPHDLFVPVGLTAHTVETLMSAGVA